MALADGFSARRSGRRTLLPSAAVLATVLLASLDASAFCRTTTCDPRKEQCETVRGCIVEGAELAWPDRCVSYGTQQDGSAKRRISYEAADRIFGEALSRWANVACEGGQRPSFQVWAWSAAYDGIVCAEPEFNKSSPNANVWMFRDDDWPYENEDATLAMTTVQFERSTGVILDADVEINSFSANITIADGGTKVEADLASIAAHEAGHFLGLSHSAVEAATMYARYSPGTLSIRDLEPDDEAGICAAYPPDRDTPSCRGPRPPNGFSRFCGNEDPGDAPRGLQGCSVSVAPLSGDTPLRGVPAVGLLGLSAALSLRRSRARARNRRGRE